jgi:hypothetical protein
MRDSHAVMASFPTIETAIGQIMKAPTEPSGTPRASWR